MFGLRIENNSVVETGWKHSGRVAASTSRCWWDSRTRVVKLKTLSCGHTQMRRLDSFAGSSLPG